MEVKAVPKSKLPREISPGPFALFYRRTAPCRRSLSISRKEIQLQQGGYDSPSGKGPGMLEIFTSLIQALNRVVWGIPALILILGVGLYYSFRTRFLQIRKLGFSLRSIWNKLRQKPEAGGVSHFQAVCTALAATVGTGNIAGVA